MFAQLRGMALMASVTLGHRSFEDLKAVMAPAEVFLPVPRERETLRRALGYAREPLPTRPKMAAPTEGLAEANV